MKTHSNSLAITSIVCGLWFLLTGSIWIYYANLVLAYPIGILGLILWNKSRKVNGVNRTNKAAICILASGFVLSIASLLILLIYN